MALWTINKITNQLAKLRPVHKPLFVKAINNRQRSMAIIGKFAYEVPLITFDLMATIPAVTLSVELLRNMLLLPS